MSSSEEKKEEEGKKEPERKREKKEVDGFNEHQSEKDFVARVDHVHMEDLVVGGKHFRALPFPRDFSIPPEFQNDEELFHVKTQAMKLIKYMSRQVISILAGSKVGYGTDPERLEHKILNTKGAILENKFFATANARMSINETYTKAHLMKQSHRLSKGNKIDFGISGGYAGVSLGFQAVSENETISGEHHMVGIIDQRYIWAHTTSGIKRPNYHKYLRKEFEEKVEKVQGLLTKEETSENKKELASELSELVGTYGTHMILKCSLGYRRLVVSEKTVKSDEELKRFKGGLNASVLSYAKVGASYKREKHEEKEFVDSLENTRTVGSPGSLEKAVTGQIDPGAWERLCAYGGDAGVISNDETIAIADVIRPAYKETAAMHRYLSYVRVRDLQKGWGANLFAVSYRLVFHKRCPDASGVFVILDAPEEGQYDSSFHPSPSVGGLLEAGRATGVTSAHITRFELSTQDEAPLGRIVTKVEVYLRTVARQQDGQYKLKAFKIKLEIDSTTKADKMEVKPLEDETNPMDIVEARTEVFRWRDESKLVEKKESPGFFGRRH